MANVDALGSEFYTWDDLFIPTQQIETHKHTHEQQGPTFESSQQLLTLCKYN